MKLILGIFLALVVSDGFCQEHGRILVTSRFESSGFFNIFSLSSLLDQYYDGDVVTIVGELPDTLGTFDAIFMTGIGQAYDSNSLDIKALNLLTGYLKQGGKLYYESSVFQSGIQSFDTLIGVTQEAHLMMAYTEKSISGAKGYFTEGLSYSVKLQTPIDMNIPEIMRIEGDCEQVLFGAPAFQYQGGNHKVVLHWHILDEHYAEFIGRVACNYFGLCAPLSVDEPVQSSTHVSYDQAANVVRFDSMIDAEITIYDILGNKCFKETTHTNYIALPNTLPRSTYFVVIRAKDQLITKAFILGQ